MAIFSQRSKNAMAGVHPDLVKVLYTAIPDTPYDFTITEGVRTLARQQELYAQGRTKRGIKVTNADGVRNKSNHQAKADGYGHAVDLYPYFNGSVQTDGKEVDLRLKAISVHIKAVANRLGIGITWGGDWKDPFDAPHFELK